MPTVTPIRAQSFFGITKLPTPPWRLYPFAQAGRITMIAGEPGTGKSLLLLAAILNNYAGKPFLDFPVLPPADVLMLGMDAPVDDYGSLGRRLMAGHQIKPRPDAESHFMFLHKRLSLNELNQNLDRIFNVTPDLSWDHEGNEVETMATPSVLVVDAMRQIHIGDENDSRAMLQVMDNLRRLADSGMAVVLTHHTAKAANNYSAIYASRGSSVIAGSVDICLNLMRRGRAHRTIEGGMATTRAVFSKGRCADIPEQFDFTRVWTPDSMVIGANTQTTTIPAETPEGLLWNDLLSYAKVPVAALKDALDKEGWVKRDGRWYRKTSLTPQV